MIPLLGTVSKGWIADAVDVRFDRQYYFDPLHRHQIDVRCNEYLRDHFGDLSLFYTESNLGRLAYYTPDQVLVGGIQPSMILGMLVGAEFLPQSVMDADISVTPLAGRKWDELPSTAELLDHDLISQFDDQIELVKTKSSGKLQPIPPFFWDSSGRAAVHGPLTTAQKLFGESIFIDLMTSPQQARALLDWVTEATIALVEHYGELSGQAITEIHVGECSACMISPDLFSQLVVPAISSIGNAIAPVRLHSCGTSNHLLSAFKQIEGLRSLDTGGGTSVQKVRETLGFDFPIEIAPMVDDLMSASPETLLAWVDRVIEQNRGGPLTIVCHVEPGYDLDHLRLLKDRIAKTVGERDDKRDAAID